MGWMDRMNGTSVNVYNAETNCFEFGVAKMEGSRYFVDKTAACDPAPDIYITPGWIDLHAHINDGFGMFGINADAIGYRTGVCLVADAGTIGNFTIAGFRKYVEPTIRTNIRIFLCISPVGIIFNHEYNAMEYLNVKDTVKTINENRDLISGVKVRIARGIIRHEGIEPLRMSSEVAGITDLPLKVHIGGNPPCLSEIEPFLKKGDVITHCFNGYGDAWNDDGSPSVPLQKLIERGVVLDVGHGAGSFSFEVCRKAVGKGIPEICISTDLHAISQDAVHDLASVLSKMLAMSMALEDVIRGVTKLPAAILRLDNWCDLSVLRNATFFRIEDAPAVYLDCHGTSVSFGKRIVPAGVILNGTYFEL